MFTIKALFCMGDITADLDSDQKSEMAELQLYKILYNLKKEKNIARGKISSCQMEIETILRSKMAKTYSAQERIATLKKDIKRLEDEYIQPYQEYKKKYRDAELNRFRKPLPNPLFRPEVSPAEESPIGSVRVGGTIISDKKIANTTTKISDKINTNTTTITKNKSVNSNNTKHKNSHNTTTTNSHNITTHNTYNISFGPIQNPLFGNAPEEASAPPMPSADNDMVCSICMENQKNTVFGCGHFLCAKCAKTSTQCPFCRKVVDVRIPVFSS